MWEMRLLLAGLLLIWHRTEELNQTQFKLVECLFGFSFLPFPSFLHPRFRQESSNWPTFHWGQGALGTTSAGFLHHISRIWERFPKTVQAHPRLNTKASLEQG